MLEVEWKSAETGEEMDAVVEDTLHWMKDMGSLEEFIGRYGLNPDTFAAHVKRYIAKIEAQNAEKPEGDEDIADMESLYILGLLVGLRLKEARNAHKG